MLVLDCEVIEAFALAAGPRCSHLLLIVLSFAIAIVFVSWVVKQALFLEEVFAFSFNSCFVWLLTSYGIILDVNLLTMALEFVLILLGDVLLDHADKADELATFHLLRVEVISFSYKEMGDDLICAVLRKHITIEFDVMEELLVAVLVEVIHDGQLRWIELDH